MVSFLGILLTFTAQGRSDSSGEEISKDRFFKWGVTVTGTGTIIWACGQPMIEDYLVFVHHH